MCLLCGRSGAGRVTGARTSIVKALRRSVKAKSRRFSPRRLVLFGFRARSPSRSFPALARHCAGGFYRQVNCRPARRLYWPVLAPAKAFVRAESKRRRWCGIRNAELGRGNECVRHGDSGGAGGIGLRLALYSVVTVCVWHLVFVAAVCPRFMLSVAVRLSHLPSTRVRHCSSIGQVTSVCAWLCILLSRFASVCVWHLISVTAVCPRSAPGDVLLLRRFSSARSAIAVLLWRFALGICPTSHFCRGALPRFTPAVCRMATNRTACDILRSYSAGRDRLRAFSQCPSVICLGWFTSGFSVYLRRSRRGAGDVGDG